MVGPLGSPGQTGSTADGTSLDTGKWMNIVKKADGAWKIQCDIYDSDLPVPAEAAE